MKGLPYSPAANSEETSIFTIKPKLGKHGEVIFSNNFLRSKHIDRIVAKDEESLMSVSYLFPPNVVIQLPRGIKSEEGSFLTSYDINPKNNTLTIYDDNNKNIIEYSKNNGKGKIKNIDSQFMTSELVQFLTDKIQLNEISIYNLKEQIDQIRDTYERTKDKKLEKQLEKLEQRVIMSTSRNELLTDAKESLTDILNKSS
jgi:hypothetical protein